MKNLFEEEQQTPEAPEAPSETVEVQEPTNEPSEPVIEPVEAVEAPAVTTEQAQDMPIEQAGDDLGTTEGTAETFPRAYVDKLRKEAAGYRERAKRADDLAQRLHTSLVEGTGRLADARDLPFDESHLDDPQALQTAIEELLAERPHLASRRPMGNIGQGVAPVSNDVSLGGILRAGAM